MVALLQDDRYPNAGGAASSIDRATEEYLMKLLQWKAVWSCCIAVAVVYCTVYMKMLWVVWSSRTLGMWGEGERALTLCKPLLLMEKVVVVVVSTNGDRCQPSAVSWSRNLLQIMDSVEEEICNTQDRIKIFLFLFFAVMWSSQRWWNTQALVSFYVKKWKSQTKCPI